MELKKEKVVMWRQWLLTFVCFLLSCFHALCFAYAAGLGVSRMIAVFKLDQPFFPFMGLLVLLCVISPSLTALSYAIISLYLVSDFNSKLVKQNLKPLFGPTIKDFYAYESQVLGTDSHKEVAWDFTKLTFGICACVHAVAFALEGCFDIFDAPGLFTEALMVVISSALALYSVMTFVVNLKIALRLGEDEKSGEYEPLAVSDEQSIEDLELGCPKHVLP